MPAADRSTLLAILFPDDAREARIRAGDPSLAVPLATRTVRTRASLVDRYRDLGRAMADETISDADMTALRRERDAVQAEIDAIDAAARTVAS